MGGGKGRGLGQRFFLGLGIRYRGCLAHTAWLAGMNAGGGGRPDQQMGCGWAEGASQVKPSQTNTMMTL